MTDTDLLAARYRMGRLLGRGGMGAVHEAHDELLGRDVAVKLLEVDQAPQAAVERFRREAQFLAGLAHPNVVTVFDFGADDARAWLVMELLAGPTLQELLDRRGPLPVGDVTRYARQCASALAAAHAAGITHRDVKPANVMLAADGTCKLLDLGIARLSGAATTQPALTQAGTILGTVPYLAPEVITGAAPEPPADMYALGGVVFALLTGRPPFRGEDLMAAMAQHVHAPPPRPSDERADVPRELDDLVVALLAKDPADRPTAAQLVARLGGSSAEAVAPTVAMGAAMPATTQLLTPDVAPANGGPTQVWASQAPAPARHRTPLIVTGALLVLALLAVVLVLANSGSDTTGTAHAGGSSSPSTGPSSRAVATRIASSSRPAPAPTSLAAALAALRTAVTRAGSTGGLSASDARDLLSRIDAMSATASGSGSGPTDGKPGKGHGGGKGKGHHGLVQDVQVGADLTGRLDDFLHHLEDLHNGGKITDAAYSSIRSAAEAVRPFAGG